VRGETLPWWFVVVVGVPSMVIAVVNEAGSEGCDEQVVGDHSRSAQIHAAECVDG
jgi:hypothetical protein